MTNLRFFLLDLGGQKAIFGYPWFVAVQPRINWKRGWIDQSHLPVILKAANAGKAQFLLRKENRPRPTNQRRYFIRSITIHPANHDQSKEGTIPEEYCRHKKVFDEESSQRLPHHTIWDHAIELLPDAPATLLGRLLPLTQKEHEKMHKFMAKHLKR